MAKEIWKETPDDHDYPAAANYLSLIATEDMVTKTVDDIKAAPISHYFAKDILRASGLQLLPADNQHVAKDLQKVKDKIELSPVLLIRGSIAAVHPLEIADGYHRVCASYHLGENESIPCKIVDFKG